MRVRIDGNSIIKAVQINSLRKIAKQPIEGISIFTENTIFDFYYDFNLYSVDEAKEDFEDRMKQVLVEGFLDMTDGAFCRMNVLNCDDLDE